MTLHARLQLLDLAIEQWPEARRQGLAETMAVARRMLWLLFRIEIAGGDEVGSRAENAPVWLSAAGPFMGEEG